MIKPILALKQKCEIDNFPHLQRGSEKKHKQDCECEGTGSQEVKIYALRDFEKCYTTLNHHKLCVCKGTGYKIPFKDYEIKKVSEITEEEASDLIIEGKLKLKIPYVSFEKNTWKENLIDYFYSEHNLKEGDSVVIK